MSDNQGQDVNSLVNVNYSKHLRRGDTKAQKQSLLPKI